MRKKLTPKQIHILSTAEELIAEKGFKDTSVREICKKAKVNVAMISYYFGSKEKMMNTLYEYRVQRSKQKFSEFTQTITNGRPDMQIKAIINFIVDELLKYKHFHGFVTQEMQHSESTRTLLTDFYLSSAVIIQKIIEKGISMGIFKKATKAEDLISTIIGTILFTIRNKPFYINFLECNEEELLPNIGSKVKSHLYNCTFSLIGYDEE